MSLTLKEIGVVVALTTIGLGRGAPASAQSTLLVHLPSTPVETASRLAEAVDLLAEYLSEQVDGLELEPRLFRRWSDADDFLESSGDGVVLLLTDAGFLIDRGDSAAGWVPTHRFERDGKGTYRRVLVVRSAEQGVEKLVDLRGRTLSFVETMGSSDLVYLERAVFEGEIAPLDWFGKLEKVDDDFLATNAVLFDQADAALVAEHNPLLRDHLGQDLRTLYTSPPLSLPILTVRGSAFRGQRRSALDAALGRLAKDPRGQKVLTVLEMSGLEPLRGSLQRTVTALPSLPGKELEIALPSTDLPSFDLPPLPPAGELPFTLSVELPDVALPREEGL